MEGILVILQSFSPMAVIALSLFIIYQLVNQKKSVNGMKSNHLHEINVTLNRIELLMTRNNIDTGRIITGIEIIKTKLNNRDKL